MDNDRGDRAVLVVVAMAGVVVVLGFQAWRAGTHWLPTTDWALIELQVRNAWSAFPLLGAPSADGFHHPGPLSYLLIAPGYWLFGATPRALLMSAAMLNAAWIGAAVWLMWRRGGAVLASFTLALLLWVFGGGGSSWLIDPWNPWLAVLPFAVFSLGAAAIIDGDWHGAAAMVLGGSVAAQAHVAFLAPVVAVGLLVCGVVGIRMWKSRTGLPPLRGSLLVVTLGFVLWLPPFVEQLRYSPGNVSLIRTELAFPQEHLARIGVSRELFGLLARELGWGGAWMRGPEPTGITNAVSGLWPGRLWLPAALAVAMLGMAIWVGDRKRRWGLVSCSLTAFFAFTVSLTRLEHERVFPYIVRGLWVIGALFVLGCAAPIVDRINAGTARVKRGTGLGVLTYLFVYACLSMVSHQPLIPVYNPETASIQAQCLSEVIPAMLADAGSANVHLETDELFWPVLAGPLMNELDRHGNVLTVAPKLGFFLGRPWVGGGAEVAYYVETTGESAAGTLVAECDMLSAEERAFVDTADLGSGDPEIRLRVFTLTSRNVRVAVYRR